MPTFRATLSTAAATDCAVIYSSSPVSMSPGVPVVIMERNYYFGRAVWYLHTLHFERVFLGGRCRLSEGGVGYLRSYNLLNCCTFTSLY